MLKHRRAYYPYTQLFGFRSKRIGLRRWRASAYNMKQSGRTRFLVITECDRRRPNLRTRSKQVEVPAHGTASLSVRCGARREAVAGGFKGEVDAPTGDGSFPYRLKRAKGRVWRAAAFAGGPAAPFTAYVYCDRKRPRSS
jgi:hypothetical protein